MPPALRTVETCAEGVQVIRNNAYLFIQQTHIACFMCMSGLTHGKGARDANSVIQRVGLESAEIKNKILSFIKSKISIILCITKKEKNSANYKMSSMVKCIQISERSKMCLRIGEMW